MKIEIESLDDLRDLIGVMNPDFLRRCNKELSRVVDTGRCSSETTQGNVGVLREQLQRTVAAEYQDHVTKLCAETEIPDGLPADIESPVLAATELATRNDSLPDDERVVTDDTAGRDADGVQHNTDWHSDPAKLNADGRWRARRKRDEAAYAEWLLEQAVEVAEAAVAADEAEPVATETHALPQDEETAPEADTASEVPAADPTDPGATVDLEALVSDSLEAAQDASDSHIDLLNACRDFTSKHGHPAFTALKAAVAPDKATGQGKAVQQFAPDERRLMQACIANYPA